MSDSLPKLPQKPVPPTPPTKPIPPTPPTKPTPPTHLTQNADNEVKETVSPEKHIDYNSIGAAQLKSTKIQKSQATSTPQKPKLKKSKKVSSSLLEDAKQAKNRRGGRISAKEFRKIFGKWLLSMILWNALPVLLIVCPLADGSRPSSLEATPNVDGLIGTVLFGYIALVIINIILFFRIGLKTLAAQVQRVNDLGWNGRLVVSMTVAFIIVSDYAANFVRTPSDSDAEKLLAIAILLPSVLWGMVLLGLSLFKKGQAIPNKYGSPCNDDN